MASVNRRGDSWRAQVKRDGKRYTATFDTEREANDWCIRVEADLIAGKVVTTSGRTFSLRDALVRYRDEVSTTRKGQRWEQIRLNRFMKDSIADIKLDALTPDNLGRWRDERAKTISAGSVLREMSLLSSVLELARKEWRWIPTNPLKDVNKPRKPRPRNRLLYLGEERRLLEALGYREDGKIERHTHQTAVAFLFALETAMRCGEIVSLEWSRVYLSKRYVVVDDSKNGDRREIPLSTRAADLLWKLHGIHPVKCFTVSEGVCSSTFLKARKRAGIEGLTFHDSRAEALTRLSKRLGVLELARMVGHRDPRSLMIYYRTKAEDLAKMLD